MGCIFTQNKDSEFCPPSLTVDIHLEGITSWPVWAWGRITATITVSVYIWHVSILWRHNLKKLSLIKRANICVKHNLGWIFILTVGAFRTFHSVLLGAPLTSCAVLNCGNVWSICPVKCPSVPVCAASPHCCSSPLTHFVFGICCHDSPHCSFSQVK